jgi:hypothetical protein
MREFLFWSAVLSCAAGQVLIIRSTWRAREHAATAPMPAGVPRPGARSEIAWVVLPAVMLALVLLFTWRAMHAPAMAMPMDGAHAMPMSSL